MTIQPSLFISHGGPNLILYPSATRDFWAQLGKDLARPDAILIMSAHFETEAPVFEIGEKPDMIYDFGGFEPELYSMTYAAPGAPALAETAARLAMDAGLKPGLLRGRGYDHGTWTLLKVMFPEADIPVATLSVQPQMSGAHHLALGRAVAPLRHENVLIIGSGAATHNLRAFFTSQDTPDWVNSFNDWLSSRVEAGDTQALADWEQAPEARRNHPTPEHFLPLPFALGAGGARAKGERIHRAMVGALSLDAYRFDESRAH
jgi:4,5-DOPA dioxygenase extradiol